MTETRSQQVIGRFVAPELEQAEPAGTRLSRTWRAAGSTVESQRARGPWKGRLALRRLNGNAGRDGGSTDTRLKSISMEANG